MSIVLTIMGWMIIWFMCMFIVPILTMLLHGYLTEFRDQEESTVVFFVTFALYWLVSGILLVVLA
jgi:hypothetical protein